MMKKKKVVGYRKTGTNNGMGSQTKRGKIREEFDVYAFFTESTETHYEGVSDVWKRAVHYCAAEELDGVAICWLSVYTLSPVAYNSVLYATKKGVKVFEAFKGIELYIDDTGFPKINRRKIQYEEATCTPDICRGGIIKEFPKEEAFGYGTFSNPISEDTLYNTLFKESPKEESDICDMVEFGKKLEELLNKPLKLSQLNKSGGRVYKTLMKGEVLSRKEDEKEDDLTRGDLIIFQKAVKDYFEAAQKASEAFDENFATIGVKKESVTADTGKNSSKVVDGSVADTVTGQCDFIFENYTTDQIEQIVAVLRKGIRYV